jgi:4-coumarate--CoA ligase
MPKFNVNKFLLYLDIYRITFMTGVPVVMTMLTKHKTPEMYNLKAIETVVTGSAPLNPEIGRIVEQVYLNDMVKVKQGYGMTECTCSVAGFTPDDEDDGRSVGSLNANCRAKIVEVEGRDFSASTPRGAITGEIWISGPNVMKGYYKKPEETAEAMVFEDGELWFRTGDIGYFDDRGCIYIVDRLKV